MKEIILKTLMKSDGFISGERLSKELGVSRTAVWKNIKKLKEEGYSITSVSNKGYYLEKETTDLVEEAIRMNLGEMTRFKKICIYETIDSTNSEAKRLRINNNVDEALVIAQEQTQGKGRRGRNWISEYRVGIFTSMLLKPNIHPNEASMLTLVAGLAVVRAINKVTGLKPEIKWPNDVVINKHKICGILTEMSAEMDYINYVIVGIGINVNNTTFDQSIEALASSLKMVSGKEVSRLKLLTVLIAEFEALYEVFLINKDLGFMIEDYNQVCININREVKVIEREKVRIGIGKEVTKIGTLIVTDSRNKTFTVQAGEVSVRGIHGYV